VVDSSHREHTCGEVELWACQWVCLPLGIRRRGMGVGCMMLKRASGLARRNLALPIAPCGKPGSGLGMQRMRSMCALVRCAGFPNWAGVVAVSLHELAWIQ